MNSIDQSEQFSKSRFLVSIDVRIHFKLLNSMPVVVINDLAPVVILVS